MFSQTFVVSLLLAAASSVMAASTNTARATFDVKSASTAYVGKQWNVTPLYEVHFDSSVAGSNGTYAFLRQLTNSLPVGNSFATVVFDTNNNVVQFSGKYIPSTYVEDSLPNITLDQAVAAGEKATSATYTGNAPSYGYIGRSDGRMAFGYILQFKDSAGTVYEAYINGLTGNIDQITNLSTGISITPQ